MKSPLLSHLWKGASHAAVACATVAALLVPTRVPFAQAHTADGSPLHAATSIGAAQLMQSFAHAADRRDSATLERLLHPAFRVVFKVSPTAAPTVLDRAQYMQMVREGRIGGPDRVVAVSSVTLSDGFATGVGRMTHGSATFRSVFSLVQNETHWLVLQESVLMTRSTSPGN